MLIYQFTSIPPSNRSKVKSSVQRGLRQRLLETYPGFEPYIEEIMPKKGSLEAVKLYVRSRTATAYLIAEVEAEVEAIISSSIPSNTIESTVPTESPSTR